MYSKKTKERVIHDWMDGKFKNINRLAQHHEIDFHTVEKWIKTEFLSITKTGKQQHTKKLNTINSARRALNTFPVKSEFASIDEEVKYLRAKTAYQDALFEVLGIDLSSIRKKKDLNQ